MIMGCGGCASAGERCGNGLEKIYPTTAIRYGRMRHIGEFSHPPDMKFTCGAKVVVSTDRGIELGEQVSLTCFGCDKSVNRDQMRAYAEASGADTYRLKAGRILREATQPDLAEWRHIEGAVFDKLQRARALARELDLPMKVADCEHLFGGERIVFYFLAEQRIDFRQLVHQLAGEFQTRIEMRQVGARDEARLVADYETCGRECCCKNFLKTLKPISMSMAKIQKTTLDLSKVSGRCGRLKCCLRYEHETYEELDKKLPRMNGWIRTSHGIGQVVDRQVLTQLVKIRQADGKLVTVVVEDVLETNVTPPPPPAERDERPGGNGHARPRWQNRSADSARPSPPRGDQLREQARPEPPDPAEPLEPPPQPRQDDLVGEAPSDGGSMPPLDAGGPTGEGMRRRGRRRRRRGGEGGRDPGSGPPSESPQ